MAAAPPQDAAACLELFDPLIREWFTAEVGTPTEAQAVAWPRIATGEHVLVSAPTGSGKTLTAFLWALDRLLTGAWDGDKVRVLYISPLRALNTDVRRNLERPLASLRERFEAAGRTAPRVRVMTRSGDTPQGERRKMLRHPPEILVTTPESLNILLTSASGRQLLGDLQAVILDEIHAVADSKRGVHLMTAVERLVLLSGEFQRIALSATVKPMDVVGDMVAGRRRGPEPGVFEARPIRILKSTASKTYDVAVRFAAGVSEGAAGEDGEEGGRLDDDAMLERMMRQVQGVVQGNRSTLLFANSRRMTEKATRLLNAAGKSDLAYSHHGSLSRHVRSVVEKRLKEGELKAIVATSSLELGIDVGALDEVLLVQAPYSVASAVQRIGRAGHGVGEVSRGVFFPTHGRDLLESAVVSRAVVEQDIESLQLIEGPLDVLAQVILSMAVGQSWQIDELFDEVRTAWAYRNLTRAAFDRVLDMLAGRYADSRIRELRPRVHLDRARGTVKARQGVERLIYMAGGTIADRGYFSLRLHDTMAKIGELDEEFVWERSIGDAFSLGNQSWQIRKITHNDVLVAPSRRAAGIAPFWRADVQDRGYELCSKIAEFLARSESRLGHADFRHELETDWNLDKAAVDALLELLKSQKEICSGRLPRHDRLLVERCGDRMGGRSGSELMILHTFWGGTVNRPLAMVLKAAWDERYPDPLDIFQDDGCLLIRVPERMSPSELFALVAPEHVEALLRRCLEQSGFFGSRFRWAAGTAMLLPKAGFRRRMPLWLSRQKSKKLLDSVADYGDFPMILEAWRTCLRDEFDLERLKERLARVRSGELPMEEAHSQGPSPLAAGLVWQYTNRYMYEDDSPEGARAGSGLSPDVLQEVLHSSALRPRLPKALCEQLRHKLQRLAPGYAPSSGDELRLWVDERLALPADEWRELLAAVERDHPGESQSLEELSFEAEGLRVARRGDGPPLVTTEAALQRMVRALDSEGPSSWRVTPSLEALEDPETASWHDVEADTLPESDSDDEVTWDGSALVAEWMRFQTVVEASRVQSLFDLDDVTWQLHLEPLLTARELVADDLMGQGRAELCDAQNLEILLRWLRQDRRPVFEPRPSAELPLFLARHQGLLEPGAGLEGLQDALERLFGLPLAAGLWEKEVLPARTEPYYGSWLDSCLQQSELGWLGMGKGKVTFGFESDLELFYDPPSTDVSEPVEEPESDGPSEGQAADDEGADRVLKALAATTGSLAVSDLARQSELTTGEVSEALWQLAWQGRAHSDSWRSVRLGAQDRFQSGLVDVPALPTAGASRRGRRRMTSRGVGWKTKTPQSRWTAAPRRLEALDALEQDEWAKDRARLLLGRYGLVCRELLAREASPFQWSRVFRALRLMELSGEVLAGYFFQGLSGLQFITQKAFRALQEDPSSDAVYGYCAADPASLCGVDVEGLKGTLPTRRDTNHLVYHGTHLALVSRRRGEALDIHVPEDFPRLTELWWPLRHLLTREVQPLPNIRVQTINDEPAAQSPYAASLAESFQATREGRVLRLFKQYR